VNRVILDSLAAVVLGSGLSATAFKCILLIQALRSWRGASDTPPGGPDRIVAQGELFGAIGGLVGALLILALGVIWVLIVVSAPPPSGTDPPVSLVGIALAAILVALAVLTSLQGLIALVYGSKLHNAMATQRSLCSDSTFPGCPYVTPERLETVRQQALDLAAQMEHLRAAHTPPEAERSE
jgi:hypothetical protein